MKTVLLVLLLTFVAAASAFAPPSVWGSSAVGVRASTTRQFMFSTESDAPKPLSEDGGEGDAAPLAAAEVVGESEAKKMYAKDMTSGEVRELKFVDPAMSANTNPLQMNWWAWILFGFPFILLANDAFHFLPKDGPIGFLGRM